MNCSICRHRRGDSLCSVALRDYREIYYNRRSLLSRGLRDASPFVSPRRKRMPDHVSTATMDHESIIDNFEQMLTFVEAPSSTVSGATQKMDMQLRKFEEFTNVIIPPQYKKKFARLVTDDRISDLLDMARYESGDTIEAIYYLAEHDIDIYKQDVRTRIDDLISGEENIDDFLEYLRSLK